MDIYGLFDGLMKRSNQFSGEIAEQRFRSSDRSEFFSPPAAIIKTFPEQNRPGCRLTAQKKIRP
jgi:hypothetical protein